MPTFIRLFLAVFIALATSSCRTIVDPPDPQPSCVIPTADSFQTTEIKYFGGIRMFSAAGEVTDAIVLSHFIAAHPFFSAVDFTEPYIPVRLTFSSGEKAAFTSAFSTTNFSAQCDGVNILMQSIDTSAAFTLSDTSGTAFRSALFYPQNLNLYTVTTPSAGLQYSVRVVAKYLLNPDGNNYSAPVNRYYYNLQNGGIGQSTVFLSAVTPPVVTLEIGDTIVFQTGKLTYQKL